MQLYSLLNADETHYIQVANQKADLTREVTTVGMMEAPDIIDFLVEGQLLVTTGFHFYQDIPALTSLIREMDERNCAAIGIKDQRYFDKIPQEVLDVANELQFPVLLLPKDTGLSVVVRDLLHRLLESQSNALSRIIEHTSKLSTFILEEGPTSLFLEKISMIINKELFLINSHYVVTYTSKNIDEHAQYIGQTLKASLTQKLLDLSEPLIGTYDNHTIALLPINTDFQSDGLFLGILDYENGNKEATLLLQQIVNLLGFSTLRTLINEEAKRQIKNDLFTSIISKKVDSSVLVEQLRLQEVDTFTLHKCAIVSIQQVTTSYLISYKMVRRVHDYLKWFLDEEQLDYQLFINGEELVFLIPSLDMTFKRLYHLQTFLSEQIATPYTVVIGYSHSELPLIQTHTLFTEAAEALTLVTNPPERTLIEYRPKVISELLQLIPNNEQESYIEDNLLALMQLENPVEKAELIETLYHYFYHSRAINKVASSLFLHRNTVIYRLKKIEQILHVSLEDPEVRMRLTIAILLLRNHTDNPR
ncbi:purine catabolism regulatory protein [Enterococcus sp. DIV2402]|uniref:Purine catabolism regulatory protein n=1 Tax=Candidatus Enterococcus lowellii TaxID=2230877 RepID=A0ABZ2SMJ8_9ENTE|nr:PucR family transcriptional regulator [Enterococcus sp. DIV2402]MBO0464135.1 PucR family transcriptional regulator [Enterococcus sp. DIV2402]